MVAKCPGGTYWTISEAVMSTLPGVYKTMDWFQLNIVGKVWDISVLDILMQKCYIMSWWYEMVYCHKVCYVTKQ